VSGESRCKRCGQCCQQGGPALHGADLALLQSGQLTQEDLVTVRRGELALQPMAQTPEPVSSEFLKVSGKNGSWCCLFYNEAEKGCSRYGQRPVACGLLDCTNTGPLLAIAGKDLLTRFDCIATDDPLLPVVHEYEALCPCPALGEIARERQLGSLTPERLEELSQLVQQDLAFRGRVTARFCLSLGQELFYFGRPLFQLLAPLGLQAVQSPQGVVLTQR